MLLKMTLDLATVDTDGLADGITGAGPWDESDFEATATPDGLAHQLNLTSGQNLSAITITLTGTDADDNEITEDVTGPNATTVETTKYFKTLTGVSASATLSTNTLDIGWVDEAVSPTIPLDWRLDAQSHWQWDETGTLEADIEFTTANVGSVTEQSLLPWALAVAGLDDVQDGEFWTAPAGLTAARVKFNSYSTGAEATVYASQAEIPA